MRSEDPNFKIQENGVEYVKALNAAPLEVVFAGPVDEVSNVIEDVFNIDESSVEGMQVRDKFAEFFKDKGSVEKVLSATKLPKGGNSHLAYSSYHFEDKVKFEGVGNVTPWAAEVGRRKRVKCYVQGSGRRKRKKVIGCGSGKRKVNQECFSRQHLEGKVTHKSRIARLTFSLNNMKNSQSLVKKLSIAASQGSMQSLATLHLDELIDNLKVYEIVLENDDVVSETTDEKVKLIALKAKVGRGQASSNSIWMLKSL
ncbi:hypothetical protein Tco_0986560 [Tanacetum coccineum]